MATLNVPEQRKHYIAFPKHLTTKSRVPSLTSAPQNLLWNPGPLRVLLLTEDAEEVPDLTGVNQFLIPETLASGLWATTLPPMKWETGRQTHSLICFPHSL